MKRHIASQFDLPCQETAFNLIREIIREESPKRKLAAKPDQTPELFPDIETKDKTKP